MATWIIGTDGKDRLVGTSASEIIWAKADDDVLLGSNGNDTLNGGEGTDTVSYERTGPVTVTLGSGGSAGTASKRFGGDGDLGITYTDTLSSIENVIGSSHNDTITGNELDNILAGLGGADTIRGGIGNDTIDYGASREAVTVDLRGVTQRGGDAQGDKLYTIENVIGSAKADSITGNDKANILRGGGGNDTLAGFEGADTLDGGEGIDTADYSYTPRTGLLHGGHRQPDDGHGQRCQQPCQRCRRPRRRRQPRVHRERHRHRQGRSAYRQREGQCPRWGAGPDG